MTDTSRQFGAVEQLLVAARAISTGSIALCTNRTASVSARKFGTLDMIAEEHLTQTCIMMSMPWPSAATMWTNEACECGDKTLNPSAVDRVVAWHGRGGKGATSWAGDVIY